MAAKLISAPGQKPYLNFIQHSTCHRAEVWAPFTVLSVIVDNSNGYKWNNISPAADQKDLEKYPIILSEGQIK